MASTYYQTRIESLLRHENGFSCELTQRGCHGTFDDFSDLKDHLQDRANKDCATEWLTKTFLRSIRINRLARSFQDKDPDASEAERSDSSSQPTSQDRQETSASVPDDPRSTRSASEPFSDLREGVDRLPPARRLIKINAMQHDTVETEQLAIVSRSKDATQSNEGSASHFDPFGSWDLSSTQCFWNFPPNCLRININCMQTWPESLYRIAVGGEETVPSVTWCRTISGGYCARLQIECKSMIVGPPLGVSVVYRSDQLPTKKLLLGFLDYDTTTYEWIFVPNPLLAFFNSPPTPTCAEAISDKVASVAKSPCVVPGNDHQTERSSSHEKVVNIPRQQVSETSSQAASIPNSKVVAYVVSSHFITKYLKYMDLGVVLELSVVKIPHLLTSALSFNFTGIDDLANRRSTTVQAKCSLRSSNRRDVYDIHLHSSICEWFCMRPVAVHLHLGSADAKLFVGTRRHDHEGRLVWHQASPRETCPCSSCI
jgi:hypothetical protein